MKVNFIGIGAQKAGTTWLASQLNRHPQIFIPGKELHFWDKPRENYDPAVWYSKFPDQSKINGEVTPAYSFLPREQIKKVRAAAPNARLFLSLRNPIDRAWSHALMHVKRHSMLYEETSDDWFIKHFYSPQSLNRGNYLSHIKNWCSVYGEGALHLISYDEIKLNPRRVLCDLSHHIGARPSFFQKAEYSSLKAKVFAGPGHPLRPKLRAILEEIYHEDIRTLSEMIPMDVSGWIPGSRSPENSQLG